MQPVEIHVSNGGKPWGLMIGATLLTFCLGSVTYLGALRILTGDVLVPILGGIITAAGTITGVHVGASGAVRAAQGVADAEVARTRSGTG